MIIDHLISRIKELEAPICVGLDPRLAAIPECIKTEIYAQMGKTHVAAAEILFTFNKVIIDNVCDLVPVVKPQIALYELFGASGILAYGKTVAYAKSKGLIVIGDIKRGDIASTAEAYAHAHLGVVDIEGTSFKIFETDFVTLNPYLGYDSIEPFFNDCKAHDKGMFVLVKTSNAHSKQIQDIPAMDGKPIYQHVAALVADWGKDFIGTSGFSSIGAVVGATHPQIGAELRTLMPNTFFLAPGYGAQGATAKDLRGLFNKDGLGAVINSSRGIIEAGKDKDFGLAAREAVLKMKKDLLENM